MKKSSAWFLFVALSSLSLVFGTLTASAAETTLWTDVADSTIDFVGERRIVPAFYRTVALDESGLETLLSLAPLEKSVNALGADVVLSLPMPDGNFSRFAIEVSPIMAPELGARFPEIRTYRGRGLDDPAAALRFDRTPQGFHAMVLSPSGSVYIDPYSDGDTEHYIVYFTRDARNASAADFRCSVTGDSVPAPAIEVSTPSTASTLPNGTFLKTYRLAVAATGEYTAFHGGTVNLGLAAIVTAMNRVNGIYERDLAIRMELVANNDLIVYTNGGTDPYTNNSGSTMLGQNQSNLDAVIGSTNYDIGHVFSTGGGGVASLRVPCVTGLKARGVTGLTSPVGDVFYVDYVAHEMGHQWGGNHTFNGSSGSCSGGNRNAATAYEPGSGTTIMAYAGICSPQNIQSNSDDYFHTESYQEIVNYITTGNGNNCDVATATLNTPPVPDPGASYTIPISTPFELCGSAMDADVGDVLTYGWEQYNLGPAGSPNAPVGDAPIFRSFDPATSPCRTFPQLSDLLGNTQTLGELLPSYTRTLTFRLTVRDNASAGGGVDFDTVDVDVSDVGGPFLVTSPNTVVVWESAQSQTVSWNVANTDSAPINCASVDIRLSTDGGASFPTTLLAGTSNDGSAVVSLPSVATNSARIEVRCSDNIFFDVSNADFIILENSMIFADGFETGDTSMWP